MRFYGHWIPLDACVELVRHIHGPVKSLAQEVLEHGIDEGYIDDTPGDF
jgi:hypothetical protein